MADTYTNKLLYKWYLHGWYMMRNDSLPIKIPFLATYEHLFHFFIFFLLFLFVFIPLLL